MCSSLSKGNERKSFNNIPARRLLRTFKLKRDEKKAEGKGDLKFFIYLKDCPCVSSLTERPLRQESRQSVWNLISFNGHPRGRRPRMLQPWQQITAVSFATYPVDSSSGYPVL